MKSNQGCRYILYHWGPAVLWMGFIFFLSSQSTLPEIPGVGSIDWGDKIEHAITYAILGVLIWRALGKRSKRRLVVLTILMGTVYGLSDEVHQLFVPGRSFDLLDLTADALGSAVSAIILITLKGGD
ncbi:MAG: VanZ family protein [Armatimonadota bacterium]|nr:VanZ family protein [bacterium]